MFSAPCLVSQAVTKRNFVSNPGQLHPHDFNINRLLTKREGRTGEYWPEVVAVRTEQSEVGTVTTEGQYSPVQPEQARLVSGLLYGTVSDSKMQWHTVSDSKMQLQKPFVTESDKSSC